MIKALRTNDVELTDAVYSGVPAHMFGMEQTIEIGPMSGKSNVVYWLERRGMAADELVVESIYQRAKSSDRVLSEAEILSAAKGRSRGELLSRIEGPPVHHTSHFKIPKF